MYRCVSKTVICKICVYTTKSFMGQTIDLCTMKCRGGFGEGVRGGACHKRFTIGCTSPPRQSHLWGRGGGGLSQKVHHRLYQPTPPKSFMGQTIDLCTMKCRGGFGEGVRGGGGLSQKVYHRLYQPTPPTKWSDSKNLDADKVWNLKHFQEKIQQKGKKRKKKMSKTRH